MRIPYRITPEWGGKIGMEDIVIISSNRSQAADLWVTYLKTCFDQIRKNRNKPPFRILSVEVENFGDSAYPFLSLEEKLKNAKLVIFIICPVFSDYVSQNTEQCGNICKHIRPDGVLAMLLGIGESSITNEHKAGLPNYSQWKRMESVKDRDEKFVGDFLGAAMDIISKNITQNNQPTEKGSFMLMPKKVNKSQNKVLILLNEPITKEDIMKVSVIRNNEVFEIPSVKKRNPYTLIFRMPEEFLAVSLLVSIRVERNGNDLGTKLLKCESQLYAMAQILKSCDSPVEFMCQALNIVPCDKDKLDDFLMSSFQRNVPPNFNLLQTSGLGQLHRGVISKDEFPTLLHFAARFGLEKLCWALMECPGGELACDVRNVCELTPSELAESMGHTKLANALCGYMQMTEFTSVYTFLKGMSDEKNNSNKSDSSDDYLNPRPLSETYQVPPSPRPLAQVYSHPPFGYMQMQSPKSSVSSSISDSQESGRNFSSSKERLLYRKSSEDSLKKSDGEHLTFKTLRDTSGNGTQDELIEIINDFKNNVFTISEVEKLVEDWRNRNDVRQSFKEKQEQLNKMREEYDRVQQKLKEEMKSVGRLSPLERFRNFFRSKSKDSKLGDGQDADKKTRQMESLLPHRPSSGLSIQSSTSSSSSGRLSTGSHCSGASLGDSGTHSDAESERKSRSTSGSICNSFKVKDSLDNYDVPPNPVSLANGKPKTSNGILNYDIPPSSTLLSEYGLKQQWDNESCLSCDSQGNEVNYYNLVGKDIPIPNQSALHGPIIKAASRNCLKAEKERGPDNKTEENNCYEYINLPGVDEVEGEKENIKEGPNLEIQVPDYVNVENGIK
ncbi:hypothetical protein RUM44_010432 [Polyplax serrata]|uniref:DBB domain-containing protein n=1 Tax=Polyplax serrata TaxID=468196 RepID=A0ABR1AVJ4_POLSC